MLDAYKNFGTCSIKFVTLMLESTDYGRPNEIFFHCNPNLLGLGRQFGQINFGAFGALLADLSVLLPL